MKYILFIHHGSSPTPGRDDWDSKSEEEQREIYTAWQTLHEIPGVTTGVRMADPENATTVRVQDGATLTTDGPFVELKEAIGGYCFFEGDDLDAAIEMAARIPPASTGGAIEIRPVVEG